MSHFEILCVTMQQKNFSKIKEMNIHSDVVFANQSNFTDFREIVIDGHKTKMISTQTKGVGVNRNIALMYASGEICLLADDDMVYRNQYQNIILTEFRNHPEADIIIFNIGTTTPEYGRKPPEIKKYKRFYSFSRNPYGAPRIAFRLQSIKRANLQFSTLFGGGCLYSTGEDSIWLKDALRAGLKIYLSPLFIGDVSYANSTSYCPNIKKRFYDRGAMLAGGKARMVLAQIFYYSFLRKHEGISGKKSFSLMVEGYKGFHNLRDFYTFEK